MGQDEAVEEGLAAEGFGPHGIESAAGKAARGQHADRIGEVFGKVVEEVEQGERELGRRHEDGRDHCQGQGG